MAIKKGFTLIEVLVVISIFSVVALIATQSLIRILGSTSSSNSTAVARENIEYAMSVMERGLRNAKSISACTADSITYVSESNVTETFDCATYGGITTVEQSGLALTSDQVNLSVCSFTCLPSGSGPYNAVDVLLEGSDSVANYDSAPVRLQTTVSLRSY